MMSARYLALVSALALVAPAAQLEARQQWRPPVYSQPSSQSGYNEGYQRGQRAGDDDRRRRRSFNFSDASDFRRGDLGYRPQYGSRDRYRVDFRLGFEAGYRASYGVGISLGFGTGNRDFGRPGPPAWSNGGAYGRASDLAFENGQNDGYQEGFNDGRNRHRDDPIAESRYRNATRGYDRWYGAVDHYKLNYREGFVQGYERGYREAWYR
jgi:hypothetical protein